MLGDFLMLVLPLHPRALLPSVDGRTLPLVNVGDVGNGPWPMMMMAGHAVVVVAERRVRDRKAVMALPLALRGALFFDVALPHALRIIR